MRECVNVCENVCETISIGNELRMKSKQSDKSRKLFTKTMFQTSMQLVCFALLIYSSVCKWRKRETSKLIDTLQCHFSADDSTLSKSMTILASNSQVQSNRNKSKRDVDINRCIKSKSRTEIKSHHNDTESDTSISPINEFSNMSTYRVPTKSRGGKQ